MLIVEVLLSVLAVWSLVAVAVAGLMSLLFTGARRGQLGNRSYSTGVPAVDLPEVGPVAVPAPRTGASTLQGV